MGCQRAEMEERTKGRRGKGSGSWQLGAAVKQKGLGSAGARCWLVGVGDGVGGAERADGAPRTERLVGLQIMQHLIAPKKLLDLVIVSCADAQDEMIRSGSAGWPMPRTLGWRRKGTQALFRQAPNSRRHGIIIDVCHRPTATALLTTSTSERSAIARVRAIAPVAGDPISPSRKDPDPDAFPWPRLCRIIFHE